MLENHHILKSIKGKASSIYPLFPYDCALRQPDKEGFFLIEQRSPTFSAPGTGFMEGNFSRDGGVGVRDGPGGDARDGDQQMKLHWLARRSPPAVRPGS